MSRNAFKDALSAGKHQSGLWLSLANAYSAELCAGAGFDWLLIDGEHAPNDVGSILSQLQALAAYPVAPVVRALNHDVDAIKQLLDIGVTNLLVPMVSNAEQARALVEAVRYPPKGSRGIGHALARASRWTRDPDYFQNWEDDACLIVQIETGEGLDNLEAILDVDGVDGLLMGPADLAASLGHAGNLSHPVVLHAIDDAIARTIACGKAAGVLAVGEEAAMGYFSKGCSFVAAGVDVLLLAQAADGLVTGLKARLAQL